MFKNLQAGFTVHVLDKSGIKPAYYQGTVTNVSKPHFGQNFQMGSYPTQMVVDVSVEYGDKNDTFTVDENATYNAGATISLSCEPMPIANEVQAIKKQRDDAIASFQTIKEASAACDDILKALLPHYANQAEQEERLVRLEKAVVNISLLLDKMGGGINSQTSKKSKE